MRRCGLSTNWLGLAMYNITYLTLASKCTIARNWSTVLDQFISAASGEFDLKFWKSI